MIELKRKTREYNSCRYLWFDKNAFTDEYNLSTYKKYSVYPHPHPIVRILRDYSKRKLDGYIEADAIYCKDLFYSLKDSKYILGGLEKRGKCRISRILWQS